MKLIAFCFLVILWGCTAACAQDGKTYDLFVGTYTNPDKSNGIHVYKFDPATGQLSHRSTATGVQNPSYLAVSADNKYLYSVSEVGRGQAKVHSFSFDSQAGQLSQLNSSPAGGDGPCYVSTDAGGRFVFAGMYSSGSLSAIPLNAGGSLGSNSQVIKYEGTGINKDNLSRSHVHAAILSPDGKYLLATDLGTDKIYSYRYDAENVAPLTSGTQGVVSVKAGSGPRHIVFHPNGKSLYAVMELSAEVALMEYENGSLKVIQYITMLPEGFKGQVEAADIHVSPDGKFVYASNRADGNDIVIYSVLPDGKLSYAGRQREHIKTPRGFVIDPTGKYLLVANMDGNNIVVFKRDLATGLLNFTGIETTVDQPVCLKFSK